MSGDARHSVSDPAATLRWAYGSILFLGSGNLLLGLLGLFIRNNSLQSIRALPTVIVGLTLLGLGALVKRRSATALGVAVALVGCLVYLRLWVLLKAMWPVGILLNLAQIPIGMALLIPMSRGFRPLWELKRKRLSLTSWIFIGMAAGIFIGVVEPPAAEDLAPVSSMFLRLIKSIIAPLLFGTLVYGIAGAGSLKAMGRIGLKAIIYFEVVTTVALFLGLGAVNLVRPGEGMRLEKTAAEAALPQVSPTLSGTLEHVFPTSVFDAMARGEVLQIVVFAFLFGAACAAIGSRAQPVVSFSESLAEVMFQYTRYVMYLAPLGVGAAMAVTVGSKGFAVLVGLGKLILTMYAAQAVFVFGILGAVMLVARVPVRAFWRAAREPFLIAFSTASSEAALPTALANMERFGIPKHIVSFVIPTGYSFNLDGTTLYLSLASVFVAQAAGVPMSVGQQLLMMLTLMLTSKGVAGVPRAALVILTGTLATFGLPLEGAAVLLGIDAAMDMARTSVNVLGNCLATAVVARWEGQPVGNRGIESLTY